ncbi:MAG: DNA repair protein RecN [Candidatus Eisenbacteria bacterium]|nr:DNA repair protein RecN [Candidatus Eisenbacteria bacterium]
MLERLSIRDLALAERVEIVLGDGLHAVTGETGAGKSLVVSALGLLVGARADADIVREGARAATVEGEFRLAGDTAARVGKLLEEWGIEFDGELLIVRREVSAEGRSRATVNQSSLTIASLKRLGEWLLDLHGQHEHQSLLRDGAALATLDRLGGLEEQRAAYSESLAALREASGDLDRLRESLATFAERRDYLASAARELDDAQLREGEEDELKLEAARLAHADRLRALASAALERLSEGDAAAAESLGSARHSIEQAAALDPSLDEPLAAIQEAAIAASEAARTLADYLDRLEADPAALESIEARRELYARLTRKYRRSVSDLLAWREELRTELAQGEDGEGSLERARDRRAAAEKACRKSGKALTASRTAAAREWSALLSKELRPLGFPHARIGFEVAPLADGPSGQPGPTGLDDVQLLFTANPGEPARILQKIASGGELSRVMLALKCALQTRDRVDLLVFDEVDSGIGGAVAQAVGERLRSLAEHRQVICVTHLPMIAALGRHHLSVSKEVANGRTTARVSALEAKDRVEELARMLAGERVTDTTRRQARELLAAPAGRNPS